MAPLDQKTELHYRQCAMNMALATHESQPQRQATETVKTADAYYQFMTGNQVSANAPNLPQIIVHFIQPSNMPDDRTGAAVPRLSVCVAVDDMSLAELQTVRRRQLSELDIVAKLLKERGAVTC